MDKIELDRSALKAAEMALNVSCHPSEGATFDLPAAIRAYLAATTSEPVARYIPYGYSLVHDRHFNALAEGLAEIKATADGDSDQPITGIIEYVLSEIKASPLPTQGFAALTTPPAAPTASEPVAPTAPEDTGCVEPLCKRRDGIVCADGECDIASGVYTHPPAAPAASEPGVTGWCQPMKNGEHAPRQFAVIYEDPDQGMCTFDNEAEAREHWTRANTNWNCYLFGALPLIPAAPTYVAIEAQTLVDRLNEFIRDADDIPSINRNWFGHVEPALERLSEALASLKATRETA